MATLTEVVYPSTSSFSGTGQLNLGPYNNGSTQVLIRAEVNGVMNYQTVVMTHPTVLVALPLWALQWVPHTAAPADAVTTADGPNWLIREQVCHDDLQSTWAPSTSSGVLVASTILKGSWAGQLVIGSPIDLWLSIKSPSGLGLGNFNFFGTIRWWWAP